MALESNKYTNPNVSVVIPTYNREGFLKRAINSVLGQSYGLWELLIVDDASDDDSRKLCEALCEKDKRIRYFRPWESRRGVSASRNYGIRHSNGELIAFLDSDDEWFKQKLEKQVELYVKDAYVLCHSDEVWLRNGVRVNQMKKHKKSGGGIYLNCLPLCCISPSASIIQASVFSEIGLFDEAYPVCEDYDLWLRLCARHEVAFIEEPLIVKYGGHSDQLSRFSWGNDVYRVKSLIKILEQHGAFLEQGSILLDKKKLEASKEILIKKCDILAKGFYKHGDAVSSEYYKDLLKKY